MKKFKAILAYYDKSIDMVIMTEMDVEAENEYEALSEVSEFVNKLPQAKGKPSNWQMFEITNEIPADTTL